MKPKKKPLYDKKKLSKFRMKLILIYNRYSDANKEKRQVDAKAASDEFIAAAKTFFTTKMRPALLKIRAIKEPYEHKLATSITTLDIMAAAETEAAIKQLEDEYTGFVDEFPWLATLHAFLMADKVTEFEEDGLFAFLLWSLALPEERASPRNMWLYSRVKKFSAAIRIWEPDTWFLKEMRKRMFKECNVPDDE